MGKKVIKEYYTVEKKGLLFRIISKWFGIKFSHKDQFYIEHGKIVHYIGTQPD